ncbi:MAG: hypothetical protein V3U02_03930, partial [Calditrichia bacterium]
RYTNVIPVPHQVRGKLQRESVYPKLSSPRKRGSMDSCFRRNDTYNFSVAPLREIRSFGYLKSRDKIKILLPHYIRKDNFQAGNLADDIFFLAQI